MSTDLFFKEITIYQPKMIALEKIYNVEAPQKITIDPDSINIKYFMNLKK